MRSVNGTALLFTKKRAIHYPSIAHKAFDDHRWKCILDLPLKFSFMSSCGQQNDQPDTEIDLDRFQQSAYLFPDMNHSSHDAVK